MAVAMKGNFMLGLNLVIVNLYPMRPGATMMNAFLVNTGIILFMTPAIIQFCAQAFAIYANGSQIFDVFGNQVMYLMGIQYIYRFNIFLYAMLGVMALTFVWMCICGPRKWKKQKPGEQYATGYS